MEKSKNKKVNQEIERLNQEFKNIYDKNRFIYYEYLKMEGKYGEKINSKNFPNTIDNYHYIGVNYIYKPGMKEKEDSERKQFLIDNHYLNDDELAKLYQQTQEKIQELKKKEK